MTSSGQKIEFARLMSAPREQVVADQSCDTVAVRSPTEF